VTEQPITDLLAFMSTHGIERLHTEQVRQGRRIYVAIEPDVEDEYEEKECDE